MNIVEQKSQGIQEVRNGTSPNNISTLNKLLKLSNPLNSHDLEAKTEIELNESEISLIREHIIFEFFSIFFKFEVKIHRVVLTGGPCAGKTTSINRIKTFFENIGWRVCLLLNM